VTARLFLNESFGGEDEVELNEGENGTRDSIEDILEAIVSPNT